MKGNNKIKKKQTYVTQPTLPPLEEFISYLKIIWDSKILTNHGPFHQRLEKEMAEFLGVKHISLFANGTLALLTALQALNLSGEVITTPFSFPATSHVLWWNNIKPVFVDIEPDFCNIDPQKIESAITSKTTAILPVHIYGNPCDVHQIKKISDIYGLKVIYDAAHAFGNKFRGRSILNYGDISILSFHATKPYNTMEGGAIISQDKKTKKRIDYLRNFGFAGETTVIAPGINAKMNEMQAVLGLLQLKYYKSNISKRRKIAQEYKKNLKEISGIRLLPDYPGLSNYNYAYFPIFVDGLKYGKGRDRLYAHLRRHNIFGRRYFYPLISQFPAYRSLDSAQPGKMPIAEKITKQVLCLPIYPALELEIVGFICSLIKNFR